jgi:hypothetical protein
MPDQRHAHATTGWRLTRVNADRGGDGRVGHGDDAGMRNVILITALAGLFAVIAGCAGEESATCENLGDIQASVSELREIGPDEGAVDELRQAADEIEAEIAATRDAAEDELGTELDAFAASLQALRTDFDAATADGFSGESLSALLASVSSATAALEALIQAAPDCDL